MSGDPERQAEWLAQVRWNAEGLAPAVAVDTVTGRVLTLAWMNRDALARTVEEGCAVYWSRSRGRPWRKGETSGCVQRVQEIRLDCDRDAILLKVRQEGRVACHTGRESCFFRHFDGREWVDADPVIRDPAQMYGKEPD